MTQTEGGVFAISPWTQKMEKCHNDFTAVIMSPSMQWLWRMELGWEHDILTALKLRVNLLLQNSYSFQNWYHYNNIEYSHKKLHLSCQVQQRVICLRGKLRRSHNGGNSSGRWCSTLGPCGPQFIVTVDVRLHCSAIFTHRLSKIPQTEKQLSHSGYCKQTLYIVTVMTQSWYTAGTAWCHRKTLLYSTEIPKNMVSHILFLENHFGF